MKPPQESVDGLLTVVCYEIIEVNRAILCHIIQ